MKNSPKKMRSKHEAQTQLAREMEEFKRQVALFEAEHEERMAKIAKFFSLIEDQILGPDRDGMNAIRSKLRRQGIQKVLNQSLKALKREQTYPTRLRYLLAAKQTAAMFGMEFVTLKHMKPAILEAIDCEDWSFLRTVSRWRDDWEKREKPEPDSLGEFMVNNWKGSFSRLSDAEIVGIARKNGIVASNNQVRDRRLDLGLERHSAPSGRKKPKRTT